MPQPDDLLVFAPIGDLHLTEAQEDNCRDLQSIVTALKAFDGAETIEIATASHIGTVRHADGSDAATIGAWHLRHSAWSKPQRKEIVMRLHGEEMGR